MVGIAAIGVNRYLIRSHDALIAESLPAMERASGISAAAEVVGTLAASLAQADTVADLDRIAATLEATVARIERGAVPLQDAATGRGPGAGELVDRMRAAGQEELRLTARIAGRTEALARSGSELEELIEAETDLARLRITSGLAGLYADPQTDPRPALDALADRYFFAFERVTELARMVDAIRLLVQQVPTLTSAESVASIRAELADRLALAERRLRFLPSPAARRTAGEHIALHRAALAPDGVLALQGARIARRAEIVADSAVLRQTVSDLVDLARQARDRVQAEGLARIDAAERRASRLTLALLLVVATAVIAGALLWLYARRQLVARLGKLSQRIVAVAGGDYGEPLKITGPDEIGRMEKALNILRRRAQDAAQLRDSLEEAVIARTGEVVAEMRASDAARAEAEAISRSKTDFLARMSHEIRTPLNGIIGMLGLLENEVTDPDRRERVQTAHRSARDLLAITNDILDYAGSEARANRGNPVHFSLRELVGQLGHQLQSLASRKRLETGIDLAEDTPPVVFGDVVKIRQVVGNLISNAVKYTDRGRVTLTVDHGVDATDGMPVLIFGVADTGRGMSRAQLAHAFDAYTRTDEARRSDIEGLGLGLAISRNLTEAMGGALLVESEPGIGSRFILTVPLVPGDPALVPEEEDPLAAPGGTAGRRVLVIDDHAVNRMVARGYLEKMGSQVQEAATGQAGLDAVAKGLPDLVLIDLDLPDMNGAEVARRIGTGRNAPELVALTAHMLEDTPETRARLGVSRVLTKPLSPRALAEVLARGGPASAPATGPGHDAVVESLRSDAADLGPEVTARILGAFLADLPETVAALRAAPPEARARLAHRLKGAASNFRLEELCDALAALEAQGADADPDLLRRIEDSAGAASETLRAAAREAGIQPAAGSTK